MTTETPQSIIAHVNALNASPAFAWFLRRTITEPMQEADDTLHNPLETVENRESALARWVVLKGQADFLASESETARRALTQ